MAYMQNVVNIKTPFLGLDGKPLVGGRVKFVSPSSNEDLIDVYAKDGVSLLNNPLKLSSNGYFDDDKQPFIADGVDYKMIVEVDTGVSSAAPTEGNVWQSIYTIDSKSQKMVVEFEGIACIDSISQLRSLDPSQKSVVVLGYNSANDFCPSRVFRWNTSVCKENYGTYIKSTKEGYTTGGCWEFVTAVNDVRYFGVNPEGTTSCSDVIETISTDVGTPVYFPKGNYYFNRSADVSILIIDRYANFYAIGKNSIAIESDEVHGEGNFCVNSDGASIIPYFNKVLKVSSLAGDFSKYVTSTFMGGACKGIDVDKNLNPSSSVTLKNLNIVVRKGKSISSNVTLENCIVYDENDGSISLPKIKIGAAKIEEYGLGIKIGNAIQYLIFGNDSITSTDLNAQSLGFTGSNADDGWFALEDEWEGLFALFSRRAQIGDLKLGTLYAKDGHSIPVENLCTFKQGAIFKELVSFYKNVSVSGSFYANGAVKLNSRWGSFIGTIELYTDQFYYIPSSWVSGKETDLTLSVKYKSNPENPNYKICLSMGAGVAINGRRILIYTDRQIGIRSMQTDEDIFTMNAHERMMFICSVDDEGNVSWEADPFYI